MKICCHVYYLTIDVLKVSRSGPIVMSLTNLYETLNSNLIFIDVPKSNICLESFVMPSLLFSLVILSFFIFILLTFNCW